MCKITRLFLKPCKHGISRSLIFQITFFSLCFSCSNGASLALCSKGRKALLRTCIYCKIGISASVYISQRPRGSISYFVSLLSNFLIMRLLCLSPTHLLFRSKSIYAIKKTEDRINSPLSFYRCVQFLKNQSPMYSGCSLRNCLFFLYPTVRKGITTTTIPRYPQ